MGSIALVIGYASFRIGRDLIGVKLAEAGGPVREVDSSRFRDRTSNAASNPNDTFESRAPLQPIVEIEEVQEPSVPGEESAGTTPGETGEAAPEAGDERGAREAAGEAEGRRGIGGAVGADEEEPGAPPPMVRERSVAGAGRFRIRVGSYTDETTLVSQMARLRELGYRPLVEEEAQGGVVYKRLFAAETSTYAEAVRVQDRLQQYNITSMVIEQGNE